MREVELDPLRQKIGTYVTDLFRHMDGLLEGDIPIVIDVIQRGLSEENTVPSGDSTIFLLEFENGRKRIDLTFRPTSDEHWSSMHMETIREDVPHSPRETRILFLAAFTILQMQADATGEAIHYEDITGYTSLGEILSGTLPKLASDVKISKMDRGLSKKTGQPLATYVFSAWIKPKQHA